MDEARALSEVLDREARAATRADVDTLLALQTEKRAALDRLRAAGATPEVLEPLRKRARGNVALIRHLVACLRGVVGGDTAVYGPSGESCAADLRPLRGRG